MNRTRPNLVPQISFSGHPRHGAVGQNIFPMYISIKRHSWFFKSWWCLLYFGHVQTWTTGKCWCQKTPFCLKLSTYAQKSVLSWSISISRILGLLQKRTSHRVAGAFNAIQHMGDILPIWTCGEFFHVVCVSTLPWVIDLSYRSVNILTIIILSTIDIHTAMCLIHKKNSSF